MILEMSERTKAGVPETLVNRKLRPYSLYFPHTTLMLTESRVEFSDFILFFDFVRFAIELMFLIFSFYLELTGCV